MHPSGRLNSVSHGFPSAAGFLDGWHVRGAMEGRTGRAGPGNWLVPNGYRQEDAKAVRGEVEGAEDAKQAPLSVGVGIEVGLRSERPLIPCKRARFMQKTERREGEATRQKSNH